MKKSVWILGFLLALPNVFAAFWDFAYIDPYLLSFFVFAIIFIGVFRSVFEKKFDESGKFMALAFGIGMSATLVFYADFTLETVGTYIMMLGDFGPFVFVTLFVLLIFFLYKLLYTFIFAEKALISLFATFITMLILLTSLPRGIRDMIPPNMFTQYLWVGWIIAVILIFVLVKSLFKSSGSRIPEAKIIDVKQYSSRGPGFFKKIFGRDKNRYNKRSNQRKKEYGQIKYKYQRLIEDANKRGKQKLIPLLQQRMVNELRLITEEEQREHLQSLQKQKVLEGKSKDIKLIEDKRLRDRKEFRERTGKQLIQKYNYYSSIVQKMNKQVGGHIPKRGTPEYHAWSRAIKAMKLIEKQARKIGASLR